jgi:hypothetical protein
MTANKILQYDMTITRGMSLTIWQLANNSRIA